uniref:FBA_2 domain-containing protein n=1 Tax=Steinernema glaseri TaxID=37863 RepID=A0A1I7ZYL4_9BILA
MLILSSVSRYTLLTNTWLELARCTGLSEAKKLSRNFGNCGSFTIWEQLDDHAVKLFKEIVKRQKLPKLQINEDACEGGIVEVVESLFCQDQFHDLTIKNYIDGPWKSSVVSKLLQFWSVNSRPLRGKNFILKHLCQDGVKQLQEFVSQRQSSTSSEVEIQKALVVCSQEETDYIDKYYRHQHFLFRKPSCVYKFEEGEGDERRRLYISFECALVEHR